MERLKDRFGTREMRALFGATLVLRLVYPFFASPLDRLFSDPARHWDNALHFFEPGVMGSSDPYLYQVWLFALQRFAASGALGGFAPTVQLGTGMLCAAMPYGWYRALRELLPERQALGEPESDQQHGRPDPDLRIGRGETHEGRGPAHDHDRQQEGVLASPQIAEMAENDRAKRAHAKAGAEHGEVGEDGGRVVAGREELRAEKNGQRPVEVEVVPLEHGAEG